MTDKLISFWAWVARRRTAIGWLIAVVAVSAFAGGLLVGSSQTPPSLQAEDDLLVGTPGAPARLGSRERALEAVVVEEVRQGALLARTRSGETLTVRLLNTTRVRKNGGNVPRAQLQPGTTILVLGRPGVRPDVMRARLIAITGTIAPASRTPADAAPVQ